MLDVKGEKDDIHDIDDEASARLRDYNSFNYDEKVDQHSHDVDDLESNTYFKGVSLNMVVMVLVLILAYTVSYI